MAVNITLAANIGMGQRLRADFYENAPRHCSIYRSTKTEPLEVDPNHASTHFCVPQVYLIPEERRQLSGFDSKGAPVPNTSPSAC